MKIAIVGAGYVGLVTGVSLATLGHKVICIETDLDKISLIQSGRSPFFEPNIDKYLKKVIRQKLFQVTTRLDDAVVKSDMTIIAVGTPTVKDKIDLTFVKRASEQIGKALKNLKKYHIVAIKSTVLPGVTEKVVKPILEKYSKKRTGEFGLCMNPEFLREGSALEDALHPDRIIIGQIDTKSGREFAKIYTKVSAPKIFTNLPTAEMMKYAANGLLATLISYSNEIARISERIDEVDASDVWKGVHLDRRLSPYNGSTRIKPGILSYILSGCGFGGSCLPKDTKALASFADNLGIEAKLLKRVIDINITQPHRMILLLKNTLGKNLKDKKIAILGFAFKPNTDDTRESPAFTIIEDLLSEGAIVICHDPKAYVKKFSQAKTLQEALKNADAALIVTAWEQYYKLTPQFFKKHMKQPVVIDGRRIYDKDSFLTAGVVYRGIGL